MKDFDFSGLSIEELRQIKERIGKEIESKLEQSKRAQMAKIMDYIKNYVENYGELRIEHEYDGITIDNESCYNFFPSDNMIIIN